MEQIGWPGIAKYLSLARAAPLRGERDAPRKGEAQQAAVSHRFRANTPQYPTFQYLCRASPERGCCHSTRFSLTSYSSKRQCFFQREHLTVASGGLQRAASGESSCRLGTSPVRSCHRCRPLTRIKWGRRRCRAEIGTPLVYCAGDRTYPAHHCPARYFLCATHSVADAEFLSSRYGRYTPPVYIVSTM